MNFAEAAIQVLGEAGTPLHFRDITKRVTDQSLVEIQGQTPWNSMNGALRRVIRAQGANSLVVSLGEGKFALRAWNLPGEEVLLADDVDEPEIAGSITIAPRIQQAVEPGLRALVEGGIRTARRMAGLMVPVAEEYKPLHTTLSTIFSSGLFSILWGLVMSSGRKPAGIGMANSMLVMGCAESAAAAVGLQQLKESENDVVSGQMSKRQVRTQVNAYQRVLGYGTAIGATAFALGLLMRIGAPSGTRTKGAGAGLMTHGVLLALLTWRSSKRNR
jgi:hypothetical protein